MEMIKKKEEDKKEEVVVRKHEEELRETTIGASERQSTMNDNIAMFEKLSDGEECVIGSGRCSYHNTKLMRSVIERRVCNIDADGKVTWPGQWEMQ